jgi:hypothetical protein
MLVAGGLTVVAAVALLAFPFPEPPTCSPAFEARRQMAPPQQAPSPLAANAPPVTTLARGRRVVEQAQCGRCHALPGSGGRPTAPRGQSCAGCHGWIHASREDPDAAAEGRRQFPRWERYQETVRSFLAVPDLATSAARLDEAFTARYLRAPYKVRPALAEGMIRTGLDEADAMAAAAWLRAASARPRPSREAEEAARLPVSGAAGDVAAGGDLFARLACGQCHAQGGRPARLASVAPAPDLRLVRERMRPDALAAFIADPRALGGEPSMPRYPIGARDAARLRDFLWATASPHATRLPPSVAPTPALDRRVSYDEIRREVLDAICVHCHMDATRNGGDGGPGNTGGLGYRGAGLDLESWSGIVRGARDERGRRRSVLATCDGGEPPLVERLRARYAEHDRELAGPGAVKPGGAPGMPLGLAPLTASQLQLVVTWVAQGAPGPDGRGAPRSCLAQRHDAKPRM